MNLFSLGSMVSKHREEIKGKAIRKLNFFFLIPKKKDGSEKKLSLS